jgi:hypothetical protein
MISPQWADFPAHIDPGYTSFFLELEDDYDATETQEMLQNFDLTSIPFLRRIRQLDFHMELPSSRTYGLHN